MFFAAVKRSLFPKSSHDERAAGIALALLAYLSWGLLPLYWKELHAVPSSQAVAHRIVWSAAFCVVWLVLQRRLPELIKVFCAWRTVGIFCFTGALLGSNWLVYIWAVNQNRVLESSLGYFMTPLMNVLLGTVILRETLRPKQWIAVGLATIGVLNFALRLNALPWIALCLALTFSTYGLIRKQTAVKPIVGLAGEMILLSPLAGVFLMIVHHQSQGAFGPNTYYNVLLALTGIITVLPLWWFNIGAKRLRYSTIGVFQYLAPTCQFLLAALVFKEALSPAKLLTFLFIWAALVLYAYDTHQAYRLEKA